MNSKGTNDGTQGSIVGVVSKSIVTPVVCEVQFMPVREMIHQRNDIVDHTTICSCFVKLSSL